MNRTDNILVWTDGKVPDLFVVFFRKKMNSGAANKVKPESTFGEIALFSLSAAWL